MSDLLNKAVAELDPKVKAAGFDGSIKIEISGEGSLLINESGVAISDDSADCTLSMDADTFQGIADGTENPAGAFMSGKITVDGDMGTAMKLSGLLG